MGIFADVLEFFDVIVGWFYPFQATIPPLCMAASIYGFITIRQVLDFEESASDVLRSMHPLFIMTVLPAVPICLMLGQMINWDDCILRYLQNRYRRSYKMFEYDVVDQRNDNQIHDIAEAVIDARYPGRYRIVNMFMSFERCSVGLLLPSISQVIGRFFFSYISNKLYRTFFGGLTFIIVKGAFKIYIKYAKFIRENQQTIVDYTEESILRYQRHIHK